MVGSDEFEGSEGTQRMVNIQDKKECGHELEMTCCLRTWFLRLWSVPLASMPISVLSRPFSNAALFLKAQV